MSYFIIVCVFMMISCGSTETLTGPAGPQGPSGQAGSDGKAGVKGDKGEQGLTGENTSPVNTLEGYFTLADGGYIDVYQDAQGLYTVRNLRLVVPNQDGSTGLVPLASTTALTSVNGTVYYSGNLTYTPATHNVKQDSNNTLLTGSLLTELIIHKKDNKLEIKVIINSSSGVLFSRWIGQE